VEEEAGWLMAGYKQPYYSPKTSYEWGVFVIAQVSATINGAALLPFKIPQELLLR
jgi:hypothetical protein